MGRRLRSGSGALVLLLSLSMAWGEEGAADGFPTPRIWVTETGPLLIDRIYPSMTGPYEWLDLDTSKLGWVTGLRTEVIDAVDGTPLGGEFFCHSQVQINADTRLTVSATGAEEIRFPPGFGIPVGRILSRIPSQARELTFFGMLLNNHQPDIRRNARIRATFEYVAEEDVGSPPALKKLYTTHVSMQVQNLEWYEPEEDGPLVHDDVTTHCALVNNFNAHWMVPPGPQLTRREVTGLVPLPATVHYAQAHLHNYGRFVRLTDKATGEVLLQLDARHDTDRMQITKIPSYSSEQGFRVYPEREYVLEAFYDNTTPGDVDAMAMLYLYFNPQGDRELFLTGPKGR